MELRNAVIVDAIRTPLGKYGGVLAPVRPDDLIALLLKEMVKRNNLDYNEIEDVIIGCANQAGEDSRNVARMAIIIAGFPFEVPGQTVNRLCGSALQTIINAAMEIQTGHGDVFLAGGVENMSRGAFSFMKPEQAFPFGNITVYDTSIGWRYPNPKILDRVKPLNMGETAEVLYEKHKVPREEQDKFAVRSHLKAAEAWKNGKFNDEVIPVSIPQKKGEPIIVAKDEGPREDTTLEKMAKLKPAFKKDGIITAGNSCQLSDGAALALLMSEEKAKQLKIKPYFRILSHAVAGVHPDLMGMGPVYAVPKALKRAGLTLQDIDLIEINEAFAVQVLACLNELNIPIDKINPNGGAISLGHPLGCTGARIVATLIHEMKRQNYHYGLATLCVGIGQGTAMVVEKID